MARLNPLMVRLAAGLLVSLIPLPGILAEEGDVDFARDVLPVLSNKCFVCHGPDGENKDDLRLDSFEAATRDLGGYQAINPTKPEDSEVLIRIHDADDPMPPADAEKSLTPEERDTLTRWVRQGGEYAQHWAFVSPQKPQSPAMSRQPQSEIDAFVWERLHESGVDWAPEADKATLARRVALVLTGLPPEPEQLSEFLNDDDPGAYERLVNELLSSPKYGEHQARFWLDAVRYGDTHGLHLDNRRGIYPYRDWVVRAFNQNLPLDEFFEWQLAGDLLPNPTMENLLATGYVRMNPTTAEGGAIPEEFQAKNNFDRTETLGTVFLGLTLTCARCHTHKYDPIPQTDYYRLLAFFNSTAEKSMDGNAYIYGPVVEVPEDPAAWDEWMAFEAERDRFLAEIDRRVATQFTEALAYAQASVGWESKGWQISKPVAVDASLPEPGDDWEEANGLPGRARRLNLPGIDQAIWVSFRVEVPIDLNLELRFSGELGSEVRIDDVLQSDFGAETSTSVLSLQFQAGSHEVLIKMVGSNAKTPVEVRLDNPWEALAKAKRWESCSAMERFQMLMDGNGPLANLQLQDLAGNMLRRISAKRSSLTTSLVARDLDQPRPTHLLRRGEYNLPEGEPLEPGILSVMGSLPERAPRNRLGLAQWLTSREHPLVSRVTINRVWQRVFSEGLVRTPEDFGVQGEQPTHPDLLDWLAVELHDSGWNLKHMLRLMVTSRSFRQSSARRADVDDPENRLLARGPRHRLDAEELRDLGLWASGLLDPHMGGEGVKPYQPSGLWAALMHPASNTKQYVRDKGRRLYRRSLYVYWKRTSPHPMMTLFDAPSREASCVRRSRTNTSLQSLGLLNEPQRIEISRTLAERLLHFSDSDDDRLDQLFTLLASRRPTERERTACLGLLEAMRERYSNAEQDALALLSLGEVSRDPTLDPAEHAAWSQVATTVLASDVAILLY